jgi:hypothetical protein
MCPLEWPAPDDAQPSLRTARVDVECAGGPLVAGASAYHLSELTAYLDANADALPDYGARYRAGRPISTAFATPSAAVAALQWAGAIALRR